MQVVFRSMPRQALRHLRQGGCFAFLWDQRVAASEYTAPLFGRDLPLDPLPSFLVRHHPIPVWFGVLLPGGKWRLVQLADPARSRDPFLKLGRRYHRVLEILVRNHPASWYGLAHGRFQKTV